jgi:hypothetical protein
MGGNHAVCCSFTGARSSALQDDGAYRAQAQHPAVCPGIPAGSGTQPASAGCLVASRPFQEQEMAGSPYPEWFGPIGLCGDRYSRFSRPHGLQNALMLMDCPCARLISEPIPRRRIGPHGTHRQQKVDRGSNRTSGRAHRRRLVRRKCRGCTETLDNRRSNQGAESRQAFSGSLLAPMMVRC